MLSIYMIFRDLEIVLYVLEFIFSAFLICVCEIKVAYPSELHIPMSSSKPKVKGKKKKGSPYVKRIL